MPARLLSTSSSGLCARLWWWWAAYLSVFTHNKGLSLSLGLPVSVTAYGMGVVVVLRGAPCQVPGLTSALPPLASG